VVPYPIVPLLCSLAFWLPEPLSVSFLRWPRSISSVRLVASHMRPFTLLDDAAAIAAADMVAAAEV
jgi:hypothetical protein